MMDFDRRFAAHEKRMDRTRKFMVVWFCFCALLALSFIGGAIYVAATTSFSDLGRMAGEATKAFDEARQ